MQSNFWAGSKKFGLAQNILGPVIGQGISNLFFKILGMSWIGINASRDLTLTNQVA